MRRLLTETAIAIIDTVKNNAPVERITTTTIITVVLFSDSLVPASALDASLSVESSGVLDETSIIFATK